MSPQFHCVYDDAFDLVKSGTDCSAVWATKAGLIQETTEDDYTNKVPDWQGSPPYTPTELSPDPNDTPTLESTALEGEPTQNSTPTSTQQVTTQLHPSMESEGASVGNTVITRSGRRVRPPQRYVASFVSAITICICVCMSMAILDDRTLNDVVKLFAYPASIADNDTMYLREAMQQEDQAHFLEAMVKEINDHTTRGHWRITTRSEMRSKGYHHRPIMAV